MSDGLSMHVDSQTHDDVGMTLPTAVIVSPHFPPSTLAGVHRARHLAKHLPAHGWRPIVVRVDERHYTEQPDPMLARLLPPTLEQVRTTALPASFTRTIGISDIGIRAYTALGATVETVALREKAKVILITGSPFYPMLLAQRLRRRLGIPVVLDFQDPWVTAEGKTRPYLSKGRMAHRLSIALEPHAVRNAAWITSVSETQNAEMSARYPWLDRARMSAIPIGGDQDDFDQLRSFPATAAEGRLDPDRINLCYVGTFLPRAGVVVRALFDAAAQLRREDPMIGSRLRFVFIGTSNQPGGAATLAGNHRVTPIAQQAGVADLVDEHPARIPFLEALGVLARADALLLLGSDEPHYTASKIYPALMSERPFLSIFHAQSSSHEILTRAGGGVSLAFDHVDALAASVPAITHALRRLVTAPNSHVRSAHWHSVIAPYRAGAIAAKFAEIFGTIA